MIHLFNKIWLKQSVKTLLAIDGNFSGGGQNNRVKCLNIKSDRNVEITRIKFQNLLGQRQMTECYF